MSDVDDSARTETGHHRCLTLLMSRLSLCRRDVAQGLAEGRPEWASCRRYAASVLHQPQRQLTLTTTSLGRPGSLADGACCWRIRRRKRPTDRRRRQRPMMGCQMTRSLCPRSRMWDCDRPSMTSFRTAPLNQQRLPQGATSSRPKPHGVAVNEVMPATLKPVRTTRRTADMTASDYRPVCPTCGIRVSAFGACARSALGRTWRSTQ